MKPIPHVRPAKALLFLSILSLTHLSHAENGPAKAEYIPQRMDDIAWENDRIAHRIYGPKLEPTGSGIDVWVKSTRQPIIDEWYKRGDYHMDHGEGLDFYDVGHSRGCGGLGIWDGNQLYVSGHWATYKINQSGGQTASFTVTYAPWEIEGGHHVSETRTFTLAAGTNLTRLDSTLTSDLPDLTIGIGITKRHGGEVYRDAAKGILAYWQPPHPEHGTIGCGVIVDPKSVVGFAEDKLNYLILVRVKAGEPWSYREGACWDHGLDFHTFTEWKNYLNQQAEGK
ncbi:MAG TPA: DUF4861 family protein [Rariglobus sp.]|jgi:hypothetical protein|nr:DUF4861 family protein [Rariglobus sp.]